LQHLVTVHLRMLTVLLQDEDDSFDVEAAMLTGGSGGFMPLSGMLRGMQPTRAAMCVPAAHLLDRLQVSLDQRPVARLALYVYVVVLHVFIFV